MILARNLEKTERIETDTESGIQALQPHLRPYDQRGRLCQIALCIYLPATKKYLRHIHLFT